MEQQSATNNNLDMSLPSVLTRPGCSWKLLRTISGRIGGSAIGPVLYRCEGKANFEKIENPEETSNSTSSKCGDLPAGNTGTSTTLLKYTESGDLVDMQSDARKKLPFTQTFYYRINDEVLKIHEGINFPKLDNPMCAFKICEILEQAKKAGTDEAAGKTRLFEPILPADPLALIGDDELWVKSSNLATDSSSNSGGTKNTDAVDSYACSTFLCGDDRYAGRIAFAGDFRTFLLRYDVIGPKKDYWTHTRYEAVDAGCAS